MTTGYSIAAISVSGPHEGTPTRLGMLRSAGTTPVLRGVDGLIFQNRGFDQVCQNYRLPKEFLTLYKPEQNGLIERYFRTLKEEWFWHHPFAKFEEARQALTRWIRRDNEKRPHQALNYRSPHQYLRKLALPHA